ncbi:MAG: hypothetical protein PHT79_00280 [Syntrophomonadaceae bacterium]|nr:hypothetical protein [Syntrophomonadaceae bacterium]MDD3888765.1 hypothetical protein [Syntrophomonadaceae bacterium]MDD4548190.1 hypothetical protein [Syntrophomonadaceae bacterium]
MVQAGYDYAKSWEPNSYQQPVKKVIKRTSKKSNLGKKRIVSLCASLFIYALVAVYFCIRSASLGYEIVHLENQISQLENANQRIEYQIAQESSLGKIEQIAITELGMCKPEKHISVAAAPTAESNSTSVEISTENKENTNDTQVGSKSLKKIYASLMFLAERNN